MTLSRKTVVEASIEVVRSDEQERLAVRRLSRALDAGPGSLHVFFRDVERLYAALLEDVPRRSRPVYRQPKWTVAGPACPLCSASYTRSPARHPSMARAEHLRAGPSRPNSPPLLGVPARPARRSRHRAARRSLGRRPAPAARRRDGTPSAGRGTRGLTPAAGRSNLTAALGTMVAVRLPRVCALKDGLSSPARPRNDWAQGINVLVVAVAARRNAPVPSSDEVEAAAHDHPSNAITVSRSPSRRGEHQPIPGWRLSLGIILADRADRRHPRPDGLHHHQHRRPVDRARHRRRRSR